MNAADLLVRLESMGVRVAAVDGVLRLDAPEGVVTGAVASEVRGRRDELVALVEARSVLPPLIRSGEVGPWRLSPGQRRLWALVRGSPEDASYNLPLAYRLRGSLDRTRLDKALLRIMDRHAVLHAPFREVDGEPLQVPGEVPSTLVRLRDLSGRPPDSGELVRMVGEAARQPFDLGLGPFLRADVWRLGPDDHVLLVVMHHIVSDGWSFLVFVDELEALYGAEGGPLAPLPVEFRDVAEWQRESIAGARGGLLQHYWDARFDPPPTREGSRRQPRSRPDLHLLAELGQTEVAQLEASASRSGGTLLMASLACFGVALRAWTENEDCVVCVPAACREVPETTGVIGYVNNVLPIRFSLDGSPSFDEILVRVRTSVLGAYAHRALPLQEIASLPSLRRVRVTRAMLSLQDEPMKLPRLGDLEVEPWVVEKDAPNFDVSLLLERHPGGLTLKLGSRHGVLDAVVGQAILDGFAEAVRRAGTEPTSPLARVDRADPVGMPSPPCAECGDDGGAVRGEGDGVRDDGTHHAWMQAGLDTPVESDALLAQLIMIWEQVLGVQGVEAGSDFFELGGHSMLAVSLIDAIERETGLVLSLATLVEHPEVGDLALHLRGRGWSPPDGVLVEMARGGGDAPVFLFHSFEGHVFFYNTLAQALDRPVFGLQAVGIDGGGAPLDTVGAMARRYLAEIRRVQPTGPYRLCAMCFGIAPALEIARLLLDRAEECQVIFIDSVFEHLDPSPAAAVERRLSGPFLGQLRARAWLLHQRLRRWREIRRSTPYLQREMRLKDSIVRAWYRYEPRSYGGQVTLIRSQESEHDNSRNWHVPALEALTAGTLDTVVVPGDHFTILRQPRVSAVAQAILDAGARTPQT